MPTGTSGGWGIQIKTNLSQELKVSRNPGLVQFEILQCQKGQYRNTPTGASLVFCL